MIRSIGSTWVEYNRKLLIDVIFESESDEFLTALDVGCGEGVFSNYILQRFAQCNLLVGVDISIEEIAKAKQKSVHERTEYIVADAKYLPFKNATFDLVFSKDLLHHADKPIKVLKEIKRLSNNNIIIVEANRCNLIMLLYTKFGHPHFTLDQLKFLVSKSDLRLYKFKQLHAFPVTCRFPSENLMVTLWNIYMSLFLFTCDLITSLSEKYLRILSSLMEPSYNVLYISSESHEHTLKDNL
jgi:ubiquinone/menaquinone biosynthesis C-methylase UbiE